MVYIRAMGRNLDILLNVFVLSSTRPVEKLRWNGLKIQDYSVL